MINKKTILASCLSIFIILAISGITFRVVYTTTGLSIPYYVRSLRTDQISVAELKQLPQDDLLIIDVRSPLEHQDEHIPGSILIPIEEIDKGFGTHKLIKEIESFRATKNQAPKIILYCQTGPRSIRAFEQLTLQLDAEIFVLTGGMSAWTKAVSRTHQIEISNHNQLKEAQV